MIPTYFLFVTTKANLVFKEKSVNEIKFARFAEILIVIKYRDTKSLSIMQ
jgi:hypothetical protein